MLYVAMTGTTGTEYVAVLTNNPPGGSIICRDGQAVVWDEGAATPLEVHVLVGENGLLINDLDGFVDLTTDGMVITTEYGVLVEVPGPGEISTFSWRGQPVGQINQFDVESDETGYYIVEKRVA
jgi:hypothetical protein